ncbi:hypothetical protein RchiOBHm_Chr4g0428331 [Rosa chinensis]|uniref:Uncharacterized protein n=1 Tax=Rosa chinensis TaxID=74649 RepID=A0A2P6QZW5_ROSCH|nr:hypothetical protein RchiOBHm_Chr4g0428331 [Rosa chinensis]
MADMNWIIEEDMEGVSTQEQWKGSIYKLPAGIADINKKAYKPQTVSFGPYHFNHSNPMEKHKHRVLLHFLKRCGKPVELFADALAEVVEDLKDSYNPLEPVTASHILDDYAPTDPIFSKHWKFHVMPFIKRDMLMLENQLPMLVLVKLVTVETNKAKFCCSCTVPRNMGKCVHVLDMYRKSLLQEDPHQKIVCHRASVNGNAIIWSATELQRHPWAIRFKKSKSSSLKDISFSWGILKLPLMVVDDSTESMFLNMTAFERFHVGAGNEVTSYIFFMDSIIDNHRDVGLLQSKGIIHNFMGSDDAVAKLLNSLS